MRANAEERDLDDAYGTIGLFAPPSGGPAQWSHDFTHNILPEGLLDALGDLSNPPALQPNQSIAIFTDVELRVDNPKPLVRYLKRDDAFKHDGDTKKDHRYTWTRPYPEGHWSPLAAFGGLQVIGRVALEGDRLTVHAKSLSMTAALMHKLRDAIGGAWKLLDVTWNNPVQALR